MLITALDDLTCDQHGQRVLVRWAILSPIPPAILLALHSMFTAESAAHLSPGVHASLIALTLAFVPVSLACAYALGRGVRQSTVLGGFLLFAFSTIASICYLRGGIYSPTLGWLLVITTGTMLAAGRRLGLLSIAMAAAVIAAFYVIEQTGVGQHAGMGAESAHVRWLPNMTAIAILLYCEVALFERNKQHALDGLREANTELSAARDLADAANRSKSALLANVSHEIRSPMTAILGFADIVHERSEFAERDPAARSELETVRRSGTHLLEIINDILDLSKIEAGRFDLHVTEFSPRQLIEDIVDLMRVRADASGIRLEVELSPELPAMISGDRKRIKQILLNLVGNAIKFTRDGTVSVLVHPLGSPPFEQLRFEVTDEGIGMSPDQIQKLFRPFSQADSSTTRLYGGTGLGLAICKRLAELMQGTINVSSQLGRGSTFRVDLPTQNLHPAPQPTAAEQSPAVYGENAAEEHGPSPASASRSGDAQSAEHPHPPSRPAHSGVADHAGSAQTRSVLARSLQPPSLQPESVQPPPLQPQSMQSRSMQSRSMQSESAQHTSLLRAFSHRLRAQCDRIYRRWESIREFFIPDCLRNDPAELARARFITTFCLLPLPLIPAWALIIPHLADAESGPKLSALIVAVTPLLIAVPFQLRRGASIRVSVHVLLCYLWVMFGLLSGVTAGVGSPAVAWSLVPPIVAVATLGLREGAVWVTLCCAQLTLFQLFRHLGVQLPNVVPQTNTALIGGMNLTSVIVLMGAFGGLYQRTSAEALDSFVRTNRELVLARDRANQANASKSEFIANISHELRTPMTAILGFTDVLLDRWPRTAEEEPHVQSLETVRRNGLHLLEIINDILDLSKIEAGRIEIEREPIEPGALAREVFELMKIRAEEKEIALHLEMREQVPDWTLGDALRIRQVLMNLIGNAIKFTESGTVRVALGVTERPSGRLLTFDVRDTGIGISPDQLQVLFEPFRQADSGVSERFGGTGLGLAICKRLSELMGGRIRVRSTLGSGSVFTLEIPAAECAAPASPGTARRRKGASARDPRSHTPRRRALTPPREVSYTPVRERSPEDADASEVRIEANILLVDDSPDNQRLISWILERLGAHVSVADDGQAALDAIEAADLDERGFDLVLMDLQMPVLDGYAAIEKIRSMGRTVSIIALSAHAMAEARERAITAGADGYATKPIVKHELLPLIQRLLPGGGKAPTPRVTGRADN